MFCVDIKILFSLAVFFISVDAQGATPAGPLSSAMPVTHQSSKDAQSPYLREERPAMTPIKGVELEKRIQYYDLDGTTLADLRDQLIHRRPKEKQSNMWVGLTETQFETRYQLSNDHVHCKINAVNVSLNIVVHLPRWRPKARVTQALKNRWSLFEQAIEWHESGHVDHAIWAANQLHQRISKLRAEASCAEMDIEASMARDEVIMSYQLKDDAYDAQTNYGVNQGTMF
jgi:predicted secreted Zn-dependent protease